MQEVTGIDVSKVDFDENGAVQILDEGLLSDVVGGIASTGAEDEDLVANNCDCTNNC